MLVTWVAAPARMLIICSKARNSSVLPRSTASNRDSCSKCFRRAPCCKRASPPSSKLLAMAKSSAVTPFHVALVSHSPRLHSNRTSSASPRNTATCKAVPKPTPSDSFATCIVSISFPCHAAPRNVNLDRCTFCASASFACSYWNELVNCLFASLSWQSRQPHTVVCPLLWICRKPPCSLPSCTRRRTFSALRPSSDMSSMCCKYEQSFCILS
mmetsp:Transcript_65025/g.172144  ORF Transcript_65025/g.172144 Transcript_65025/m.172144 type:complete len:213 (+) Transcript_65025:4452-5090(+)